MFLTVMVIGLVGLVMMAVPALFGHHWPSGHGHAPGLGGPHAGHVGELTAGHAAGHALGHGSAGSHGAGGVNVHGHVTAHGHLTTSPTSAPHQLVVATTALSGRRFIPSPRAVLSWFALYGAFGNALVHAGHLGFAAAALGAIVPTFLVERLLLRPVWNLLFRSQAEPSSPLEQLILAECEAVVPFRNGRGLIATVRDGRRVQLAARLCDQDAARPVTFGQRLRIEDVDARRERVTVSLLANDTTTSRP